MSSTLSKNQKKKAAKKLKSEDGTAVAAPVVAAVAAKVEAPVAKKEIKIEAPKKVTLPLLLLHFFSTRTNDI